MMKELEKMGHVKRFKVFKIFKNRKYLLTAQDAPCRTQIRLTGFPSLAKTQELETESGPFIQIHGVYFV